MSVYLGRLTSSKLHIGIVVSRFNEFITRRLLESALETLQQAGIPRAQTDTAWVPGALEIPYFCQKFAKQKKWDVLIALACVIRGESAHFNYVCKMIQEGVLKVMLDESIPIGFGVLTTDNLKQAKSRPYVGGEAALAALELALIK